MYKRILALLALCAILLTGCITVVVEQTGESTKKNTKRMTTLQTKSPAQTDETTMTTYSVTTNFSTTQVPTTILEKPCTMVCFADSNVVLNNAVPEMRLTIVTEPFDTTDLLVFVSSDSSVISIDAYGNIRAHKQGSAIITVNCGLATAKMTVKSTYNAPTAKPTTKPTIPTKPSTPGDVQFEIPSGAFMYSTAKSMTVVWEYATVRKSPNATNSNIVTKVYNGEKLTTYYEYVGSDYTWVLSNKGWIVKPAVKEVSNADSWPYQMRINYNAPYYGDSSEAECSVELNKSIILQIVDSSGEPVSVEWKSSKAGIVDMSGDKVTRIASGRVTLTATYDSYTFKLIIS